MLHKKNTKFDKFQNAKLTNKGMKTLVGGGSFWNEFTCTAAGKSWTNDTCS